MRSRPKRKREGVLDCVVAGGLEGSGGLRRGGVAELKHFVTAGGPDGGTVCSGFGTTFMGIERDFALEFGKALANGRLQSFVAGEATGDGDFVSGIDVAQEFDHTIGDGDMNAFEDIFGADAAADHVDDIGLGQDGAD